MNRCGHAIWRFFWKIRSRQTKGLQKGDIFPDFSLKDVKGQTHSVSDIFPTKRAVLWFTNFCDDCRSKIPLVNELIQKASDKFAVLAVSLLGNDLEWPKKCGADALFPFLIDPEDTVGRKLGLPHPPDTCPLHNLFILDRDGRILFKSHLSALPADEFRKIWMGFQ